MNMGGPPFKCPDCGVWWTGVEHRCAPLIDSTGSQPLVIRTWPPFGSATASTTPMHYCAACLGWHGPTCPGSSTGEVIA